MLKFIAISGTTDVTQNLYVYETEKDMIVVDCGVGFPEQDMFGVDLVIPDFSYIKQNANKLRGILITHGHEDHMGALPFLLKDVKVPIYSTKLVAGFIEEKFEDYGLETPKVNVFNPEKDSLVVGSFRVTPFRVSHSVPDAVGFCIETPEGKVFHVPDYKFDWTPVDGRPFDIARLASLCAGRAPLAVASDALGANTPGYTESEKTLEKTIESIVREAKKKVYFTTISSNISRMQQAINVAQRLGRKVVFVGRSIDRKAGIAKELGYLFYSNDLVISSKQAQKLPDNRVMFIISGSYGQGGSALYRVAVNEHEFLTVGKGDTVIFSGDPAPPGSKTNVDFLVDRLIEANCDVHYYDMQEDLHVSGHGSQKDIEMLFAVLKPKYFIPIGGTIRHMHAYSLIAQSMGANETDVFELPEGGVLEFNKGVGKVSGRIHVKDVLVDGLGIGDVGNIVLRDRKILSKDGIAIVLIQFDRGEAKLISDPEIISRGFVFSGKAKGLLEETSRALRRELEKVERLDEKMARDKSVDFLEKYFFEKTGRRPMILPVVVEV